MLQRICKVAVFLALLLPVVPAGAQKSAPADKIRMAIRQMDDGLYDESEALLRSVIAQDSRNFDAWYELSYLQYLKKEYDAALKTALKAAKMPDASDLVYQLAGNAADYAGDPRRAVALYKQGLKKFPDSGALYLELGNMSFAARRYLEALGYYERGIAAEPTHPSNYRSAATVLLNSSEPFWGLLYGEIFVNLEPSGERNHRMSRALLDGYKAAIVIGEKEGKRSVNFKFTSNNTVTFNEKMGFLFPYPLTCTLIFEQSFPEDATEVDLESIVRMRCNFIARYFDQSDSTQAIAPHSNVLFDHMRRLADAGHLEAYSCWVLYEGDRAAADAWYKSHEQQWDVFMEWSEKNPLTIDKEHYLLRSMFDGKFTNFKD